MNRKNDAITGITSVIGLALLLTGAAGHTNNPDDSTTLDVPEGWQVATNGEARSAPEISMDEIVQRMEDKYNGTVTEIEFDREWNRDVYEIEIKTADGYEWDIEVDANSGEIIKEKRELDD